MSFVAVSKVQYPEPARGEIHAIAQRMIAIAKNQPGFVSIRFHQSRQANETMMYWEWEAESDHEACMASPDWSEIGRDTESLFGAEGMGFSIETYDRLV